MAIYWLILGALTVWRITHLLQAEDGPWGVVVRFRRALGGGFLGALLDCFYCLSVWVAVPLALLLGETWRERLLLWPALSAGAILLERATDRARVAVDAAVPDAEYMEDPEPPRSRAPHDERNP
jgi:hypothetical protein